jgi:hypothetical protein
VVPSDTSLCDSVLTSWTKESANDQPCLHDSWPTDAQILPWFMGQPTSADAQIPPYFMGRPTKAEIAEMAWNSHLARCPILWTPLDKYLTLRTLLGRYPTQLTLPEDRFSLTSKIWDIPREMSENKMVGHPTIKWLDIRQ